MPHKPADDVGNRMLIRWMNLGLCQIVLSRMLMI